MTLSWPFRIILLALLLPFPSMIASGYGIVGFIASALPTALVLFLAAYSRIDYDTEELVFSRPFRRITVRLSDVIEINYADQLTLKNGRMIKLKNNGYSSEAYDVFLESVRTSLGKQQAYRTLRARGRELLLESADAKERRKSDRLFKRLVDEYDELPVKYINDNNE